MKIEISDDIIKMFFIKSRFSGKYNQTEISEKNKHVVLLIYITEN
ncbi:MAG: hypothetical protein ACC651_14095 [Candidatus Scalindua sp.]